ncbi:hypothetical protein COLO4_26976 [Corchorus olitorius]|uniref:Uncharacterized protein n=1 Tax=Corchorus olitorius TaxID=93759 RepID=A0A1R3HTA0_9ROSI|nr:hypothetical protein COLO4_26976 [Corchorus olitorius]
MVTFTTAIARSQAVPKQAAAIAAKLNDFQSIDFLSKKQNIAAAFNDVFV